MQRPFTRAQVSKALEHTLLRSNAQQHEIIQLCTEAIEWNFGGVCVNPIYVPVCKKALQGTHIKTVGVIGFPLGATPSDVKAFETQTTVQMGADEIDMVMALGAFLDERFEEVQEDIEYVVKAAVSTPVKVIIETGLLNPEQIKRASHLVVEAGAHFIKTCTGFAAGHADPEDVAVIRKEIGPSMGIKASAGIDHADKAIALLQAGADRLGASKSVAIMTSFTAT